MFDSQVSLYADEVAEPRPRASLSLDSILDAAIELLDRDGVPGLTLRRLAAELGGGLGSVYWHVAGKEALVDLAIDAVLGRAPGPPIEEQLDAWLASAPGELPFVEAMRGQSQLHDPFAEFIGGLDLIL